jgi:uncharacterized cupredoxin-like copper-binding protein
LIDSPIHKEHELQQHPDSSKSGRAPRRRLLMKLTLTGLGLLAGSIARAHGDAAHAGKATPPSAVRKEQKPWGIAGDARRVRRTVQVRMGDDMRFKPALLQVRHGETLRLVLHNDGKLLHEFVLGTPDELQAHAELMKKFPTMEHDEPYMAHVPPGQRGEIVWHFNRAGRFRFACLIAGHFDAGMVGDVVVSAVS